MPGWRGPFKAMSGVVDGNIAVEIGDRAASVPKIITEFIDEWILNKQTLGEEMQEQIRLLIFGRGPCVKNNTALEFVPTTTAPFVLDAS